MVSFFLLAPQPLRWLGLGGCAKAMCGWPGQHMVLFAGLAFFGAASQWSISRVLLACALAGYGVLTEGFQALIPSRAPEWTDLAENLSGIVLGFVVYAGFRWIAAAFKPASMER